MQKQPSPIVHWSKSRLLLLLPYILLLGLYVFFWPLYQHYLPYGDDPAVFQGAQGSPVLWFTQGFSRYFYVFPEWTTPFTDFLRPGVDLILRAERGGFHEHYSAYFAVLFFVQASVVTLTILLGRLFGLSRSAVFAAALLVTASPAFVDEDLLNVVNHFDVWCGAFAVLAAWCVFSGRYMVALAALTAAVFTKEASLYAPLAAAITVYLLSRKKEWAALMLAPLALWLLVREFVFVANAGGVYAVAGGGLRGAALTVMKGLLQWPDGGPSLNAAKRLLAERHVSGHFADLLFFGINVYLWIILAVITLCLLRLFRKGASEASSLLALAVWLAGALSFGVLVGAHPRFGGSIYPLEVLFLLGTRKMTRGWVRSATTIGVVLLGITFALRAYQVLSTSSRQPTSDMQELVRALQQLGDGGGTVYVVNAPGAFSKPSSIAWFAGVHRNVVLLNQYEGCHRSEQAATLLLSPVNGKVLLQERLPECARLLFNGIQPVELLPALQRSETPRGSWARYTLPDSSVAAQSVRNPSTVYLNFGRVMDVTLALTPADVVLYYNWQTGNYRSTRLPVAAE